MVLRLVLLLSSAAIGLPWAAPAQEPSGLSGDTSPVSRVRPARLWVVNGGHAVLGVAMYRHARSTWGASSGRFHVKNDWSGDGLLQNDEISHFMFGYQLTKTFGAVWEWTGLSPRTARTVAAIEAAAVLTLVEMPLDAFNPDQGLGVEDLAFDYLGIAAGVVALRSPGRWDFRFSAKQNPFTGRRSFFASHSRDSDNYVFWATYRPALGFERQPVSLGIGHGVRRAANGTGMRELYLGVGTSVPDLLRAVAPRAARHVEVLGAYFVNIHIRTTVR